MNLTNKLIKYINQYNFIKKVVASEIAYINAAFEMGHDISPKEIIFPSGIISSNELEENISKKISSGKCLIYFKKRPEEHLKLVKDFLNKKILTIQFLVTEIIAIKSSRNVQ